MRICYVAVDVTVPFARGASTHVWELARHLVGRSHEVHVVSRRLSWSQAAREEQGGLTIHRVFRGMVGPLPGSRYHRTSLSQEGGSEAVKGAYGLYLGSGFALYSGLVCSRIVRRYAVDVLLERETSFGAGAVASYVTGTPMVLEVIGPRCSPYSLRAARKILAYTASMARGVDPGRLALVTAAANTDLFRPDGSRRASTRQQLGVSASPVVGYVGTFPRWHGIRELVAASRMVLQRFPGARFLMVGPYFEWARALVEAEGLGEAFIFTGPVAYEEVPDFVNAADVLVALYDPSQSRLRREFGIGSPLKLFEYMACGKPVVASRLEPIEAVIRGGETGILVPPGDPGAVAEALIYLLEEPAVAERMGAAAQREVASRYSWTQLASVFEGVLREAACA